MKMSESRARLATDPHALSQVEALLLRYPQLSEEEHEEVGDYLRRARPMDVGLLSTNKEAWTNAERFRKDNPQVFALTRTEIAVWILGGLAVLAVVLLLWDLAA